MNIKSIIRTFLLVICGICILGNSNAKAQIYFDSFEEPAVTEIATFHFLELAGKWEVTGHSIDIVNVANIWTKGKAFDGVQYADLNGEKAGEMRREFVTTIGTTYTVTFAYANNYVNQASASAQFQLAGGSGASIVSEKLTHSTSKAGDLDWDVFSVEFTANDTSTLATFTSLGNFNPSGGILIDAFAIHAPEPGATMLALLATGLLGFRRRRGYR